MLGEEAAYLTPETLAEYFRSGTPTVQPLNVDPPCRLRIDPGADTLELFVPAVGTEPDLAAFERLTVDTVDLDGDSWFCLRVESCGLHHEAYSLLASIADDMREGSSFVRATSGAVLAYRELLNSRHGLSLEQQEGLIGELLTLRHVLQVTNADAALNSWLGPYAEQHDFGFQTFDVEIKTTRSETRSHIIGSATQLQPNIDRKLWLISIQLTRAGESHNGTSLADLVGELRVAFEQCKRPFVNYLNSLGWRDVDHELYTNRYILRSMPAAYLVDDKFPAITGARLASTVPQPELVSAVSYRVNVSTLDTAVPPEPLNTFVR